MTNSQTYIGYIGTYTKGESKGIYSFKLATESKQIQEVKPAAELENPTYVTISKDNQNLYSVAKEGSLGGVAAYKINATTGELIEQNKQLSEGSSPCHIDVNSSNDAVVTAHYHRGTVESYRLTSDNQLTPPTSIIQHTGFGLDKERQEKPHVHYAGFSPDEKYIAVVDLGIDKVITYEVSEGKLSEVSSLLVKPGSGPRHLTFHPNGKYAYIMTELSSEVIVTKYDSTNGSFTEIQTIPTIPSDFTENNQGSAIHISKDGKFVYAANRGHDSIASFQVDEATGKLTLIEYTSTEGAWPRDFVLDPSEDFLVASNQESSTLVLFSRDSVTGKLELLQKDVQVPDPVCVKFLHD
ncbi:lactonase family protein [Fredinandcohnia sp. 179-A 10B2 NHS]|uniref:lactonase family protein n=1 Tax=Fredinandcohnia sp. 179-A 10B2 NHS TaxID=3235176 RepID=UPI0039A0C086